MPWVHFTARFDWMPKRQVMIAYKAGMTCLVSAACAAAAKKKGVAVDAARPDGAPRSRGNADALTFMKKVEAVLRSA